MDDLADYQQFYTKRVQNLQRIREKFVVQKTSEDAENDGLEKLKEDMVSLMENDVTLMRQLLALGEKIEELKSQPLSPAQSVSSLTTDDDFETECELVGTVNQFLISDSPHPPRKQYFSRQNSVLRIPIPPCHRHQRHERLRTIPSSLASDDHDELSSGLGSERSKSAEDEDEYQDKLSPLVSPNSSFCQKNQGRHRSHGSQDSGIQMSPNSSEENIEEVFV